MMSSEEDLDLSLREEDGKGKSSAAKTKRVRQRVDAGEPRNSYASIPNFSSRPGGGAFVNGFASKMLCDLIGVGRNPKEEFGMDGDRNGGSRMYMNGGELVFGARGGLESPERCSSAESSSSHLLRDILQQGRAASGGHAPKSPRPPPPPNDEDSNESKASIRMSTTVGQAAPAPAPSPGSSSSSSRHSNSPPLESLWQQPPDSTPPQQQPPPSSSSAEVKRARVETIVSNMLQGPRGNGGAGAGLGEGQAPVNGCKKRKLYQPQQHETPSSKSAMNGDSELYDDDDEEFSDNGGSPLAKRRNTSGGPNNSSGLYSFKQQIRQVQQQLVALQQQYMEMVVGDSTDDDMSRVNSTTTPVANNHHNHHHHHHGHSDRPRSADDLSDCEDMKPRILDHHKQDNHPRASKSSSFVDYDNASLYDEQRRLVIDDSKEATLQKSDPLQELRQSCIVQPPPCPNLDYEWLAESLKAELSTSLSQVVDAVVSRCVQRKAALAKVSPPEPSDPPKDPTLLSQMLDRKSPRTGKVIDRGTRVNGHGGLCGLRTSPFPPDIGTTPKPFFFPLKPPTSVAAATAAFLYGSPPQMPQAYSSPANSTPTPQDTPEQTEAMSLVVTPKKKRSKVTDTRLHQRGGPLCGGLGRDDVSPKYSGLLDPLPPVYHHPPPPLVPVSLPTTVAIPNPSLNQSELFHGFPYERLSQHFGAPPQMEPPPDDEGGPPLQLGSMHPILPFHGHHQRGSPDSLHLSHLKQQSNDNGDISDAGDSPAAYDSGMNLISFPRKIA